MARKKVKNARYECITSTTIHVETKDGSVEKLYRPWDETADPEDFCFMEVPAGTIVNKHFVPNNEQAEDDREAQMEEPEKYVNDDMDITLIAEEMVKRGGFKPEYDEKGKIKKTAVDVARDSIKEVIRENDAEKADSIVPAGVDIERERAIMKLLSLGKDKKEQRKAIGAILKKGGVKYFAGWEPEALAALVYDEELYET